MSDAREELLAEVGETYSIAAQKNPKTAPLALKATTMDPRQRAPLTTSTRRRS